MSLLPESEHTAWPRHDTTGSVYAEGRNTRPTTVRMHSTICSTSLCNYDQPCVQIQHLKMCSIIKLVSVSICQGYNKHIQCAAQHCNLEHMCESGSISNSVCFLQIVHDYHPTFTCNWPYHANSYIIICRDELAHQWLKCWCISV